MTEEEAKPAGSVDLVNRDPNQLNDHLQVSVAMSSTATAAAAAAAAAAAMESLMSLASPRLDGGALAPLLQFALAAWPNGTGVGNVDTSPEFELLPDVGLNASVLLDGNVTLTEVNASSALDAGQFVLRWYAGRARSQAPLFAGAGSAWLLLLASLLLARFCVRRGRSRRRRRRGEGGVAADVEKSALRIKVAAFGLALACLLLLLSLLLSGLHWANRAQLAPLSSLSASSNGSDGGGDRGGRGQSELLSSFRSSLSRVDALVEATILDTNRTTVAECRRAQPQAQRLVLRVANRLLSLLTDDFRLAPLLEIFDEILGVLRTMVGSMRSVSEARGGVLDDLTRLAGVVDIERGRLLRLLASGACDPDADADCRQLRRSVADFRIGYDSAEVDTDTSVMVVTLMKKTNVSFADIDAQVAAAKSQLYGSLDIVAKEVAKLFDLLVGAASRQFALALAEAGDFREGLRNASNDPVLLRVLSVADACVDTATALVFVIYAAFLLTLLASLALCSQFLWRRHQQLLLLQREQADVSAKSLLMCDDQESKEVAAQTPPPPPPSLSPDTAQMPPPAWLLNLLTFNGFLLLLVFFYGFAFFYAGAEVHMDACRYITTDPGVAQVDKMLSRLVDLRVWPTVERQLRQTRLPLGVTRDLLPSNAFELLLRHCGNQSLTVFHILGLRDFVNTTLLLNSATAREAIGEGRQVLIGMVQQLNTSGMIPQEVDTVLQKVLPTAAGIMDSQNYAPSIAHLQRLQLLSGAPRLQLQLLRLADELKLANASDPRHIRLRMLRRNVGETYSRILLLAPRLRQLRRSYQQLQDSRRLGNLTAQLVDCVANLRTALADKSQILRSVGDRFDQTVSEFLPEAAQFADRLLRRLTSRIGDCSGLPTTLEPLSGWCRRHAVPASVSGVCIIASCLFFHCLLLLQLGVFRTVWLL